MGKSFQTRVSVVLLAFFTLAAIVFAGINLSQETKEQTPIDGVTWFEADGGLRAHRVLQGGPGQRAGIAVGDLLVEVNGHPTPHVASLNREMFHTKPYGTATYTIDRRGYRVDYSVILDAADLSLNQGFRLIALVYLGIGLYVLFRRWTAPRSTHFYLFCLASFVLYSFKYTDRFTDFDWVIYWGNVAATALQPALFLHFALAFPLQSTEDRRIVGIRRWLIALTYLPAVVIVGLRVVAINFWSATALLDDRLNKFAYAYLATCWVLASVVFYISYLRTDLPLRRQQLKWLTRGTILAIAPFTLLYIVPYLADVPVPGIFEKLAGISLVILPLTFSWAIIRYRLMDVDLIFKRGVTYTLATATVVGLYFLLISIAGDIVQKRLPAFGSGGFITAIILAALLFDPLKRAIQERVDKLFDRKRYDYRQTLIEFGRGLSSQTDLDALLTAIVNRLSQTLSVAQVAVFLADDHGGYTLAAAYGLSQSLHINGRKNGHAFTGAHDLGGPRPWLARPGFSRFRSAWGRIAHFPRKYPACNAPARGPAAHRRRARPELLPPLPPATTHDRGGRAGPHHRRRLLIKRRCGASRVARKLYRHRAAKRTPLCEPAAEGLGVRAPQGIQREHRRVDQRRHPRRRSRRAHRKLERANGGALRAATRRGPRAQAERGLPYILRR